MTIAQHPFRGEIDVPHILDLVRGMPLFCRHVIDLPWRLSSPVINEGQDAAFWRFKQHVADTALVETDLERTLAHRAYESVGFRQVHTIRRKEKWMRGGV